MMRSSVNLDSIPMQTLGNAANPSSPTQASSPIDQYLTPEGEAEIGALLRDLEPNGQEAAQFVMHLRSHYPHFFEPGYAIYATAMDFDPRVSRRKYAAFQQLAETLAAQENSSSNTEPPSQQDLQKFEKNLLIGQTAWTASNTLETAVGYAMKQFGFSEDLNASGGIGPALMHVTAQLNLETKDDSVVDHLMTMVLALLTKGNKSKEEKIAAQILEKYVVPTYRALNTEQKAKVDKVCQVVFKEALENAEKISEKSLPKILVLRMDGPVFISAAIALAGFITMVIGLSCHALHEVIEENHLEARKGSRGGSGKKSGGGDISGAPNLICRTKQTAMAGAYTGGLAIALSVLGLVSYRLARINHHRQERARAGEMASTLRKMLPASGEQAEDSQPEPQV